MRRDGDGSDDHDEYFRFTGLQRFETAMHTLHGIVHGIGSDSHVNDKEVVRLVEWLEAHREFIDIDPIDEVLKAVTRIVADGIVDEEERADLLWLTEKFQSGGGFYDAITADMQRLHGYLSGIIADGVVEEVELIALADWLGEHEHLKGCWPYDELDAIICHVMKDGKIDDQEHEALLQFFGEFDKAGERRAIGSLDRSYSVNGVCAMCPEIEFIDQVFCFTGASERGPRKHIAGIVEEKGGRFTNSITNATNYLIVGADGNPCWAYACYGRKVEEAVKRRRDGQRLLIVHEYDFWDAVG